MIDETAEEIREMRTHSSSVVAVKAAQALLEVTEQSFPTVEEYVRALERNSSALRRANSSHASLVTTQRQIVAAIDEGDFEGVETAKERTRDVIQSVIADVERGKAKAAERLAEELSDGSTLLLHDYSTTVIEAITKAIGAGKSFDAYVTEARPRYLGRKTARELGAIDGVAPTLIVDGAAGHYMSDIDEVLVGMDCVVDDVLYNRIGTYPIAAVAANANVPVTVAGSSAKIVDGSFQFENDFRSPSEVIREPPEGFDVTNPAYDATPTDLLSRVVTDEGIREC
ncbi:translation initiation factor eIF-2B [Halanaeroarchaeum sulfurireducens]|uniref:Translation initiation factor aIF-2B n=1 Tax=Halanaeroarchaeum sulfurireducens TaxID=1604004 RepID=A0A0F7P9U5_9EURY|nr:translation initiation factor eIF-2B [Halanaeroarchaeum sulfurireducens]AKH97921.1 translation initiation factor aIF-2B [Halanaeroarchaeum sulfurireducens]ALG82315.1 translation initiation factor aIF-2B [Halanaeroarchaeum sulfurireducens]